MGGTNLYTPLENALSMDIPEGYIKKVLVLTDGYTESTESVINLGAKVKCPIHTIGVGDDVDK